MSNPTHTPKVVREQLGALAVLRLYNPAKINALDLEMIRALETHLKDIEQDSAVLAVLLEGEGEKGFCAGGDMKSVYQHKDQDPEPFVKTYFGEEFALDARIHAYPKPVLVYMKGIVMGGGIGLAMGARYRLTDSNTRFAMPEMKLGYFPDVGATWFLPRVPFQIGRYLALTAKSLQADELVMLGLADARIEANAYRQLRQDLAYLRDFGHDSIQLLLKNYAQPLGICPVYEDRQLINRHFSHDTMEEIIASLASDSRPRAQEALEALRAVSPRSLKIALRAMQKGQDSTLQECFERELRMCGRIVHTPDFFEGIDAVLISKHQSPVWKPARLEEVSEDWVERFTQ